ncbi:flagellar biosynthesis protein FlhF [Desulfogranum mediterraneum]|uniref:flagellar biosynthesis protein FlhF n=1 Tax=Desulfogranum mediterraneum TaxID=160661 RepID=UPI00041E0C5F|nr:flagellar biosynthesis protein FlhF [Desulfogranum mediterraneum]
MQVKVFEATDMASGLKQVKETFGPDALILSTRTIRKGKLGLMSKPVLEITAAIDKGFQEEPVSPATSMPQHASPLPAPARRQFASAALTGRSEPAAARDELSYETLWEPPAARDEASNERSSGETAQLKSEIAGLKDTLNGLTRQISSLQPQAAPAKASVKPDFTVPGRPAQGNHPLLGMLEEYGLNQATQAAVAAQADEILYSAGSGKELDLHSVVKGVIARMITTQKLLHTKIREQQRISLVGPTGVGKTTTIAKMAANYLSRFGGRIALITIDTYRIAAVEQLKVYGEIMRLPVEVVIKPEDLDQALERFQDYDLILVDTAGRSPRNRGDLEEMAAFLRPQHNISNHLLLSATTRERELHDTINNFSILPISTFLFSKLDECEQLGVILNIHSAHHTPISYLTNGQRVPEDIIAPNPAVVADFIANDHRNPNNG